MLCNRRPGSSAPRFVHSSFSDEVLIRVIKISAETSEMDSFLFNLGKGYQPQPSASADNPYLNLDYSGYHKNLIQ